MTDVLSNVVSVLVFLGAPLILLLFLAMRVEYWHESIIEPPLEEEGEHHSHEHSSKKQVHHT